MNRYFIIGVREEVCFSLKFLHQKFLFVNDISIDLKIKDHCFRGKYQSGNTWRIDNTSDFDMRHLKTALEISGITMGIFKATDTRKTKYKKWNFFPLSVLYLTEMNIQFYSGINKIQDSIMLIRF